MSINESGDLTYCTEGPEDAPVLVFLHGWPDDASLWRNQVAALRDRYRCIVPTFPNFGGAPIESGGCDFPDLIARLHATLATVTTEPITLVTHDWGAYIGYLYEQKYPERVRTMVAMDVGGHFEPSTFRDAALFVSYQWALASFWLIGGAIPAVGTGLTRLLARLLNVPARQADSVRSRCNYPYFYFWRSTLLPKMRSRLLGAYTPTCRVLYLYGGKKPLMFHTDRWLEIVEKSGGRSVCLPRGSHWFMEEEVEHTNALLRDWLIDA